MGSEHAGLIMSRYNCLLPCNRCHSMITGVGGPIWFEASARALVAREGYHKVYQWLIAICEFLFAGEEAFQRFVSLDWSPLQTGDDDEE